MSEGPPGMAGHEARMRMALRQAGRAAEAGEVPVGAVIFNSGALAGQAWNQTQTLKDPTAHAEIIAITQAAAADRARILQYVMDRFSESVRAHPENYFWFNKRWVLGEERKA